MRSSLSSPVRRHPWRSGFGLVTVALLAVTAIAVQAAQANADSDNNANDSEFTYQLDFRWSLVTWMGAEGIAVDDALSGAVGDAVIEDVTAVFAWDGATQSWLAFFPDAVGIPGANDLTAFATGNSYWIAIDEPGGVTWTIDTDATPEPTPTPEPEPTPTPTEEPELDELTVHYIDVGQADATLVEDGEFAILIDVGHWQRSEVVPYLQSVGIDEIDLVIGTHPHADHIGEIPDVLDSFTVNEVWMSGYEHDTQTYQNAVDAIDASDATYHEPRTTDTRTYGDAELTVLNPPDASGDIHEMSISVRIEWGEVAFVFTGDAEEETEQWMVDSGQDLEAQIYQAGHHGSNTSSTQAFLDAMEPEVAIYSAGEGNPHGHPHVEVLDRFHVMGIDVYGTDTHGTVIVTTDGLTYEIESESGLGPQPPPDDPPQPTPTPTCVDINHASHDELQEIIHVGPTIATRIEDGRPYGSVDDLIDVSGIGESRLADIKEQGLACV